LEEAVVLGAHFDGDRDCPFAHVHMVRRIPN
jgi:hypothetical protein